jgi:hypothetical protein
MRAHWRRARGGTKAPNSEDWQPRLPGGIAKRNAGLTEFVLGAFAHATQSADKEYLQACLTALMDNLHLPVHSLHEAGSGERGKLD